TFTNESYARKSMVQVPPTLDVVRGHNNAAEFGARPIVSFYGKIFLVDSTVSILTTSRVTASRSNHRDVAFDSKPGHRLYTLWDGIRGLWRHDSPRVIDGVMTTLLHLWSFIVVALALHPFQLQVANAKQRQVPLVWIGIPSTEGLLVLYSYTTNSPERPDQWTVQFFPSRPHTFYLSDRPANRNVDLIQLNVSDSVLLRMLLGSVFSYHPWAPELAGILKFVQLASLHSFETTVQLDSTRGSVHRPHLRPSITRIGGPPAQVVTQPISAALSPARNHVSVRWEEIPTTEGILILYGCAATSPKSLAQWTVQYFPRHPYTYYLSDRPANPDMDLNQPHLADSALLTMLLRSVSMHDPWGQQLAGITLEIPEDIFEDYGATTSTLEVDVVPIRPCTSGLDTLDLTSEIDTPATQVTGIESNPETALEAPVPLSPLEGTGDAESLEFGDNKVEAITSLAPPPSFSVGGRDYTFPRPSRPTISTPEISPWQAHRSAPTYLPGSSFTSTRTLPSSSCNTVGDQHFPMAHRPYPTSAPYQYPPMVYLPYPYGTLLPYQQAPMVYHAYTTPAAHQHIPAMYHQHPARQMMPKPLTGEKEAAAARQETGPSSHSWQTKHHNGARLLDLGSIGVGEEVLAEVDDEPVEAQEKRYRRGGKRNTARKHKLKELERQRRGEGGPEAGPSRPN
ncbi:hypothetical protein FS837_007202, partial [Tulasnella sp. UAMH 9824]